MQNVNFIEDVYFGGKLFQGCEYSWHCPTQRNLFFLSPVRLFDSAISGVRVCRRPDGLGNIQYQTLSFSGDSRGVSTQFISLFPNPVISWTQVMADVDQVVLWEEMLMAIRFDLAEWFVKRRMPDCQIHPSAMAIELCSQFQYFELEGSLAKAVPRPPPPLFSARRGRLILSNGPPNWVQPRGLPRSPSQALTCALFCLLNVLEFRHRVLVTQPSQFMGLKTLR